MYPAWNSYSSDLSSDWSPRPQPGLGDAIHAASEVLHNLGESSPLLFRLDAVHVVAGQVDPWQIRSFATMRFLMNFSSTLHSGKRDQEVAVTSSQSLEPFSCRILNMSRELEVIRVASAQHEEEGDEDRQRDLSCASRRRYCIVASSEMIFLLTSEIWLVFSILQLNGSQDWLLVPTT